MGLNFYDGRHTHIKDRTSNSGVARCLSNFDSCAFDRDALGRDNLVLAHLDEDGDFDCECGATMPRDFVFCGGCGRKLRVGE